MLRTGKPLQQARSGLTPWCWEAGTCEFPSLKHYQTYIKKRTAIPLLAEAGELPCGGVVNSLSVPTRKLPGSSYAIQLQTNLDRSGKISLVKGKWPIAEKVCPALDEKTVASILEDMIESEGFSPNPRVIKRIVEELLEEISETPKTPAVTEKPSLIEEEEVSPVVTSQTPTEMPVTPPVSDVTTSPSLTSSSSTIEGATLSEETFEHIQVLKTQIKELNALMKTLSDKFDALNIIAEKLEGQTN